VSDVIVEVELEVAQQVRNLKFNLLYSNPIERFGPGESHDFRVDHKITHPGNHSLRCKVSYMRHVVDRREFKKVYKFVVSDPIRVKHRISHLKSDEMLVEVRVRNKSQTSRLLCDKVTLKPSKEFVLVQGYVDHSPCTSVVQLHPGGGHNFLYKMVSTSSIVHHAEASSSSSSSNGGEKEDSSSPSSLSNVQIRAGGKLQNTTPIKTGYSHNRHQHHPDPHGLEAIGNFEIRWRSNLGEPGSKNFVLSRKPPAVEALKLTIENLPDVCVMEMPFVVCCKIKNKKKGNEKSKFGGSFVEESACGCISSWPIRS